MFTQDELDAAIAKIMRTSIRRSYGTLGNRQVNLTFNDTKDAAAGVFILFPNAVFYVALLAARQLRESIATTQTTLTDLIETVRAVDRYVTPVKNVSSLANAKVALDALSEALQARSIAFGNVSAVPAYQRFDKNTQLFLSESSSNIRSGTALVRTPSEARARIGTLLRSLAAQHSDVTTRIGYLTDVVEDFSKLNLPGLLSQSIISNARDVLQGRVDELLELTPDQRLEVLRDVTLDVLAARATVKGFSNLNAPTTFLPITGSGQVFADAEHPATAATLLSLPGPFNIVPYLAGGGGGDVLDFVVDGDATTVSMINSFVARFDGTVQEPYDVDDPNLLGMDTRRIRFGVRNYPVVGDTTEFDVVFVSDNTKNAWEVCAEFNNNVPPGVPVVAEPYANPLLFMGNVDIQITGPTSAIFTSTNPLTSFPTLGVGNGDRLVIRTGSHRGEIYEVVDAYDNILECDAISAIGVGDELNQTIEVADGFLAVRFRVTNVTDAPRPEYRLQALENRVSLYFPTQDPIGGNQAQGLSIFGFLPLMEVRSIPSSAADVVKAFKLSAATALGGRARIDAETVFDPSLYIGQGRTDPDNVTRVVVSKFQDTGAATAGLTPTFTVAGAAAAGVEVGDTVIVRSHLDPSQVGNKGAVTAVTASNVSAIMDNAVIAGTVTVEMGPTLSLPFDALLRITGDGPNTGEYRILSNDSFELEVVPSVPVAVAGGKQPLSFTLEIGLNRVRFSSLDTTLDTSLSVSALGSNSALTQFFAGPVSAVGSTFFFQLPEMPKALEVDDVLELYESQFDDPTTAASVNGLEAATRVIELGTALPTNGNAYTFSLDTPVPFARIRKRRLENYALLRNELEDILAESWSKASALTELNRLMNAVLANKNPTLSQIGTVLSQLEAISNGLADLNVVLAGYDADVVPQVDTLIETFREKAAQRALDLLLSARVADFFGLSQDQVSYAGALEAAVREVEKNDLPVRRTDRQGRALAAMATIAEYSDTDFEYDRSDVDTGLEPDIPGAQGIPFPGQSY